MKKKNATYGGLTTLMLQEQLRQMKLKAKFYFGEQAEVILSYDIGNDDYCVQLWPDGI